MVRLASLFLALSSLSALALAHAPDLEDHPNDSRCEVYTDGEGPTALCGPLFTIAAQVVYLGDTLPPTIQPVVNQLTAVLGGEDTPLADLVQPLTDTLVDNVIIASGGILGAVGGVVKTLLPQCKCDLGACFAAIGAAASATQSGSDTSESACETAAARCAPFYSNAELSANVAGCASVFAQAEADVETAVAEGRKARMGKVKRRATFAERSTRRRAL
ncbi:hypothetical protein JCM6882_004631 [Rhodosporidiobolus microsporus]